MRSRKTLQRTGMNFKIPTRFGASVGRKTVHQNERHGGTSLLRKQAGRPCNGIQKMSELLLDQTVLE